MACQNPCSPTPSPAHAPTWTGLVFPSRPETGRASTNHQQMRENAAMDGDSLLDELQEDLGSDYSPQLRVAAGMLSGDAQAAVPYLLFSIAKSLEDISFLLSNDSVSVVMESDEDEELGAKERIPPAGSARTAPAGAAARSPRGTGGSADRVTPAARWTG